MFVAVPGRKAPAAMIATEVTRDQVGLTVASGSSSYSKSPTLALSDGSDLRIVYVIRCVRTCAHYGTKYHGREPLTEPAFIGDMCVGCIAICMLLAPATMLSENCSKHVKAGNEWLVQIRLRSVDPYSYYTKTATTTTRGISRIV